MQRKSDSIIITMILSVSFLFSIPDSASALMRIKLGLVTKPGSAQNILVDKFKELIEHRSNREIRIKIYHSGSLGNETELLQQVQINRIQMAVITGGLFDTFDPITRVINFPFLFKDNTQADRILDGPLGRQILKSLESSGFKGLSFSENGFRNLTNNKRPVKSPNDLKGLKIRVMTSNIHKSIWETLGAVPVPMPWPIYKELEQGLIDGQENPLWVMEVYKLFQIQKHMTLSRHVYSYHIEIASLKWWNTLGVKYRKMIQKTVYDAAIYQRHNNRSRNKARLAFLEAMGMQIEYHPDISAFRSKIMDIRNDHIYMDPKVQTLLDKVLKAVD